MAKRKRSPGTTEKKEDSQEAKKACKKEKEDAPKEKWSKSKKKRMRRLKAKLKKKDAGEGFRHDVKPKEELPSQVQSDEENEKKELGKSSLQESFKARLSGSRFRILNEELYTTTSSTAFERFSSNPQLYEQYHDGFRHQVEQWPVNPVDVIVKSLKNQANADRSKLVIADFGCGDAALAKKLSKVQIKGKCPFDLHSFDLVAVCDLVTACDMAKVPLEKGSVDVGIFCLSLMGTNLADFIREAHRVLKTDGRLKIAEVRSRFESRSDKDELGDFIKVLDQLGFECIKKDRSNKMFVLLELKKNGKVPKKHLAFTAKPCIYKRR